MPNYASVVVGVIKELIGVAAAFVPPPKLDEKTILTDLEAAEINTERIKLVRVLLDEVKDDVKCPSCKAHVEKAEEEVSWLEKEVPRIERVTALRENLKNLLEEAQKEMSAGGAGFEPESLEPLLEEKQQKETLVPTVPVAVPHKEKSKETTKTMEPSKPKETTKTMEPSKPVSGRTYEGQTDSGYCIECTEGHLMKAATEMRHAVDRYRTAGSMTDGVVEKVRVALQEVVGIDEDIANLKNAPDNVKAELREILDKSRWLRKEFGISARGLTIGEGGMKDLEDLRQAIFDMQTKTYQVAKHCPICLKKVKVLNPEPITNS